MDALKMAAQVAGALGDSLNLLGGGILALDVLWRPNELQEKKELEDFAEEFRKAGIPAVYKDIRLDEPASVALGLTLRAVRRGKRGFVILCIGFFFLFVGRAVEIYNVLHE